MYILKNLIKAFIVVGVLLAVINLALVDTKPPVPTQPHMTPFVSSEVTLIGDVTDVSPTIWDGTGHTSITVGGDTPVLIIGSLGAPGHEPTDLKLKDRLLRRWIGKHVKIVGICIVENGKALIAKVIEELPVKATESNKAVCTGTVTKINSPSPVCPHGGITVDDTILVLIVGQRVPGHEPTRFMPNGLSLNDLVGHKVTVTGTRVYHSTALYAETLEAL